MSLYVFHILSAYIKHIKIVDSSYFKVE